MFMKLDTLRKLLKIVKKNSLADLGSTAINGLFLQQNFLIIHFLHVVKKNYHLNFQELTLIFIRTFQTMT